MARIPIFNNQDFGGFTEQSDILDANSVVRTSPVRLFTHVGATLNISYEFLVRDNAAATWTMRWYQEFYADHPHVGADTASARGFTDSAGNSYGFNANWPYPTVRDFPGAPANTRPWAELHHAVGDITWAREQVAVVNNDGTIDHFDATRRMTLTNLQAKWFPMEVHSYWTRLALWGIADLASGATLQIWAHVGGHAEDRFLQEETAPYSYNHAIA